MEVIIILTLIIIFLIITLFILIIKNYILKDNLKKINNKKQSINMKTLQDKMSSVKCKDFSGNIVDMFKISTYAIDHTNVLLFLKSGQTQTLRYSTREKAKKMYKKLLKYDKQWSALLLTLDKDDDYCWY